MIPKFEYSFDGEEVIVYWDDEEIGVRDSGNISVRNGVPIDPPVTEVVNSHIQASGTPDRIEMQNSLALFGISRR